MLAWMLLLINLGETGQIIILRSDKNQRCKSMQHKIIEILMLTGFWHWDFIIDFFDQS